MLKTCKNGHQYTQRGPKKRGCHHCQKEYKKRYYQEHKQEQKNYYDERRRIHPEIERDRLTDWRRRRPDKKHLQYHRWKQRHPLGTTHQAMINRCNNPNCLAYSNYGGRGIKVCKRWLGPKGYERFAKDMGPKPTPKHTLERKNNSRGYSPGNCKWATYSEQMLNRRNTKFLTHDGRTQRLSEWAAELKITSTSLSNRIRKGWTGKKLFSVNLKEFYRIRNEAVREQYAGEAQWLGRRYAA